MDLNVFSKRVMVFLLSVLLPISVVHAAAPSVFPPQVTGDGLYGQYYNYGYDPLNDSNFPSGGSLALSRVDPILNFSNWGTVPAAPTVQTTNFGVVWTGYIYVANSGIWDFQTQSDDGVRVWIDQDGTGFTNQNLFIDDWTLHGNTTDNTLTYFCVFLSCSSYSNGPYLSQGYYPIKVAYFNHLGASVISLSWQYEGSSIWNPGSSWQLIPQSNLFSGQPLQLQTVSQPCGSLNQIELDFSEPLDTTSAQKSKNYQIQGANGINITNAVINPINASSVLLTTNKALTSGTTYSVSVSNVLDQAGYSVVSPSSGQLIPQAGTQLAPGLYGRYFNQNQQANAFFTGKEIDRVDSTINFPQLSPGVWPVAGFGNQTTNFSTEWDGYLIPSQTDDYTITLTSDDGSLMSLSGAQIINQWQLQAATSQTSNSIHLLKGQTYPVHIGYFQGPGYSVMQLAWTPSSTGTTSIIPSSNLAYCAANPLSGFSVSAGSFASTCTPSQITITALGNTGQPDTTWTGALAITTSSGHGDWSLVQGNGTLVPGASDSGTATYTFVSGDNGSVTLDLSNSHADTLTVNVSAQTYTGKSTPIQFQTNAFVIQSVDPLGNDVIAGRPHAFQVQAIRQNGTGGSSCGVATQYSGSKNLLAWISRDALDPQGAAPSINGVTLPNSAPASANLNNLSFSQGVASFNLNTTDVGKWSINLTDNSGSFAQNGTILGSSPVYVIRPFGFALDFSGNRASNGLKDGTWSYADALTVSPYFVKAGQPFSMSVRAVQWVSGQSISTPSDTPAAGTNLLTNPSTPSFNGTPSLAAVQVLPATATPGTLSTSSIGSFVSGTATSSLSYSDVGIININAQLSAYLGGSATIQGSAPNTGRFVPDHYSLNAATLTPACGSGSSGFTYMAQPMNVLWSLAAQNTSNQPTLNYTGSWYTLALNGSQTPGVNFTADDASTSVTPLSGRLSTGSWSGTWTQGLSSMLSTTVTLNNLSQPDGSFDHFQLGLSATDSDGIGLTGLNMSSTGSATPDSVLLGTSSERYGRIWMGANNGSELLPLTIPVTAQYYVNLGNGQGAFETNTLDQCTQVALTPAASPNYGALTLSNPTGTLSTASTTPSYQTPYSTTLVNGQTQVTLSAPKVPGSIELSLPGLPAWLRLYPYQWTIPGIGATTPAALATFGVYQGRAPIIYWREQFR